MPAQYIYSVSTGSNVDLSARVRAYRARARTNAEEGSVAISTLVVDDEESGIDITGLRQLDWRESSEGSNTRTIARLFTADRDISRGPFRVERARQWSVNVADINSILNRRIMRGTDANRPAETDVARIQWLMSTTEISPITDSTYISTSGPVAMDAVDYRNQRVIDIVDDCAQQSGKNYFVLLNEIPAPATVALFYDYAHSTAYASAIRLTNVLSEVTDSQTFGILNETLKLNRDPSRVYSSLIVPYDGGDVYVTSAAIGNAFQYRDTIAPSVNVKSSAKAQARGIRYLADADTEEDRLDISFIVPLAQVNQLREGQTFQVKFSHLPGYTDWTWVRALSRTVSAESEEYYRIDLEASGASRAVTSCSAGAATMSSGAYAPAPVGLVSSPVIYASVPAPPSYPSVAYGVLGVQRYGTCICGSSPVLAAPWTTEHCWDPSPNYNHSQNAVGYQALTSGSPGTFQYSWNGNAVWHGLVVAYIPTAATAPVQTTAYQDASGNYLTLGATPTVGNMLVMTRIIEVKSGGAADVVGFTRIASTNFEDTDPGYDLDVSIWVRCVQTGDGTTFNNYGGSYPKNTTLAEWAIT